MKSSNRSLISIPLIAWLVIPALCHAGGKFQIDRVWYHIERGVYVGKVRVIVLSEAKYRKSGSGMTRDTWIFQTFLNHSEATSQLGNWKEPTYWGEGLTGTSEPENGKKIFCTLGCGAEGDVPLCDADDAEVTYLGIAATTFYGDRDRFSKKYGSRERTKCKFSVGGIVEGLKQGTLTLSNNGDMVEIKSDGKFVFPETLHDGDEYSVAIAQQPSGSLRCWVDPETASGRIEVADVKDVQVRCMATCRATKLTVPEPGDYEAAGADHCVSASLVNNGDGTVADFANNLLWTEDFVKLGDQRAVRDACRDLVKAGRADWVLPDIAQLQTLLPDCGGAMYNCIGSYENGYRALFWSSSGANDGYCGVLVSCHWLIRYIEPYDLFPHGHIGWLRDTEPALSRCVTVLIK